MANVQCERGYTRIATELLKAIYYKVTNPTHLRIILFVIRFTYGYNRKDFQTNVSSLATTLRLSADYCREQLVDLSDKCLVIKIKWTSLKHLTISLNKDYDSWNFDR